MCCSSLPLHSMDIYEMFITHCWKTVLDMVLKGRTFHKTYLTQVFSQQHVSSPPINSLDLRKYPSFILLCSCGFRTCALKTCSSGHQCCVKSGEKASSQLFQFTGKNDVLLTTRRQHKCCVFYPETHSRQPLEPARKSYSTVGTTLDHINL